MTEFSSSAVLQSLEEAYAENKLDEALTRHWAQYVTSVFTAKLDADPGREERKAEKFLFRPMETFMCHGDPTEVFRQLKKQDQPPELCGKVFKVGEPTYSCRDCGMDPTCVLCIDCFERSAHKSHRYKMSTSGGGGYCDCGDTEAWKSEPFCDFHRRREQAESREQSPVDALPCDIRDRVSAVFYSTINYAAKMLFWQDCESPPKELLPPADLKNIYVTMLFNDETHTYEQVISCLEKAIQCTHKEAVDHATTVDREGRSPIYYGKCDESHAAKDIIERQTQRGGNKPLKVLVMHSTVVSHQNFAQKVMTWLQQIITKSDGLRQLFCRLSLANWPGEDQSIVEKFMLMDTQLWKACRIQSHQLFMSGILMDPESKKQFAVLFTKNYRAVMKDFTGDDHYRSVSVTAATVQLFTVPTLARMLITNHDLLHVILQVFLEACQGKKNDKGKLAFERQNHLQTQAFRRTQYMLYDLRYALTCRPQPSDWTPDLRKNFLHGVQDLLELLKCMQGMDMVVRQVTQHIEFEPEWEGAFNLQLKLQDIICMILDWAGSDLEVLKETFRLTLAAVRDCWSNEGGTEDVFIYGHLAQCINYTVSKQPVSIHLPVTRLLAGLFPKLNLLGIPLQQICAESELSPVALMEPALRSQVLVAQTSAGMWRRNGYSLLNQMYFYHNVRCRSEMFDRDILMLQVGAALIEPDEFLIHLIYKFGLMKWIVPPLALMEEDREKDREADSHRQIILLADEFLHCLIVILNERYSVGVGNVLPKDSTKREIIHQLCMQPMAHSELVKALPDDPYHETSIDDIVHDVATFKKPQGLTGKGMYWVKPEFHDKYSPFFYHYTKSEQAKSEEALRKRKQRDDDEESTSSSESKVIPPPIPPDFTPGFSPIINLLQSDVFIRIAHTIIVRATAKYVRWFTDSHLDKLFHLLGLALLEEKKAHQRGDHSFRFIDKALRVHEGESILSLLDRLVGHQNITHSAQIDLLAWLRFKFAEVRELHDSSYKMDPNEFPLMSTDDLDAKRRKSSKQKAARCRNKMMHRMASMQKRFIKGNMSMWEQAQTDLENAESQSADMTMAEVLEKTDHPVVVGPKKTQPCIGGSVKQMCILCQETDDIVHNGRAMVLAGFVQMSTVLSKHRGHLPEDQEAVDPLFTPATLDCGSYTSSCGHVMHADCWQKFYDSVVNKERRRSLRFRHNLSYDIEKSEFLCPLCECLGNTVIPIVPSLPTLLMEREKTELSLNDWLDGILKTVRNSIQEDTESSADEFFLLVPCPMSKITKLMAESVAKNFQLLFDYVYDDASTHFSDSIITMLRKFSGDSYSIGLGVHPDENNSRVPIMSWNTCAFTIMATERCLFNDKKALFGALSSRQQDCLSALVRFSAVTGQVIQPELIRKQCIRLLSALLSSTLTDKRMQPTPGVRSVDLFHYLVALCLSLPTLYAEEDAAPTKLTRLPTGDLNDHHVLQLVFAAHIVQVVLAADLPKQDSMEMESTAAEDKLVQLYVKLRQSSGLDASSVPSHHQLESYLHEACLPFLRCCAIFFNQLTEVRPAEALYNAQPVNEFWTLCEYLDLPKDIVPLFEQSAILGQLVESWCKDKVTETSLSRYPLSVNELVPLPHHYSELINKISMFTCPKNEGDDSRAPTMCLVCGAILCSQSYCCQTELNHTVVGAATAHAQSCGAGVGIFLRVRESQVVLLSGQTKGCFFAPPYLDVYGETDQGLRRGNPLQLCPERYKKLHKLWLAHSVPEEIAHVLESNTNLLSIEWHNL